MAGYKEKLLDPRWQRRRLEVLERDNFTCRLCESTEKTLHVHHKHYLPVWDKETNPDDWGEISVWEQPWMAEDDALVTLCADCHEWEGDDIKDVMTNINRFLRERFSSYELFDVCMVLTSIERNVVDWGEGDRERARRKIDAKG